MRVAPLGAYFADDLDMVVEQAERSAVTTHCHPEAVAGAIAVALAAALTWQHRNTPQAPTFSELLQQVHQRTPASDVRRGIKNAIVLPKGTPVRAAVALLGNGSMVTAQDTVPFALWRPACHRNNYEEAPWPTVSGFAHRNPPSSMPVDQLVIHTQSQPLPTHCL